VCLSVRDDISRTTRAIFTVFCILFLAVARSCSGRGRNLKGAIFGGFLPIDNALYSRALGIHTITTEPIEMPFGMMSGLCLRNIVLRGGDNHDSSNAATVD